MNEDGWHRTRRDGGAPEEAFKDSTAVYFKRVMAHANPPGSIYRFANDPVHEAEDGWTVRAFGGRTITCFDCGQEV